MAGKYCFDGDQLLVEYGDDVELLAEVGQELEKSMPGYLADLQTAFDQKDAGQVHHVGHTIKGMVSNFYATDVVAVALAVEKSGSAGDLETALAAHDELKTGCQKLVEDLRAFLKEKSAA